MSASGQHQNANTIDEIEDHDRGLSFDLQTLGRRQALGLFGGLSLAVLAGCGTGAASGSAASGTSSAATSAATSASGTAAACGTEIPDETAGPYPGDGSNGPNVLAESGIVRSDIRSSFGSSTTTAQGIPASVTLTVQDTASGCSAMAGAAVYLWHCDRDGRYSMYDQEIADENYLRGVQEADANGQVSFRTVFPAAYSGRWPHMHFEVYAGLSDATAAGQIVKTSQLALPQDACDAVYASAGYEQSVRNLAQTSLQRDNVFGDDGGVYQIGAVTGSVSDGYAISLTVPV